jgi:hypothetical protein
LATLVEIGVEEHLMVREAGVPVLVMSDVLGPGVLARRFRRRITGRDRFGATEIRIGIQRTRPPEYHSCLEDLSPWEVGIKGIHQRVECRGSTASRVVVRFSKG